MKSEEKLKSFDDSIFYRIRKYQPEIMEELLRLILKDDTLKFKSSSCREIPSDVSECDYIHDFMYDDATKMRTGSFKEYMQLLEINKEF